MTTASSLSHRQSQVPRGNCNPATPERVLPPNYKYQAHFRPPLRHTDTSGKCTRDICARGHLHSRVSTNSGGQHIRGVCTSARSEVSANSGDVHIQSV
jgi:hypothetical protein